eukprot:TRINITY_DN11584_c0_g1_i1.p1 TRINITY_DN11584_c0_g1~~TRINITY_DN11584_c0_g1_i1.p1  ORF type:complete len:674 (-),score=164.48 TRINITY_DN11584_c0_g1_i1:386-2407(-)
MSSTIEGAETGSKVHEESPISELHFVHSLVPPASPALEPTFKQFLQSLIGLQKFAKEYPSKEHSVDAELQGRLVLGQAHSLGLLPEATESDPEAVKDMERVKLLSLKNLRAQLEEQVKQHPDFFNEDGASLYTSLDQILEKYGEGPFSRENAFIQQAILEHVVAPFQRIHSDASEHVLLMSNFTDEIRRLTRNIANISLRLGQDTFVADRANLEESRNHLVQTLWDEHQKRVKVVDTPSVVPSLLEESSQRFQQDVSADSNKKEALITKHAEARKQSQAMSEKQKQYLKDQIQACRLAKKDAETNLAGAEAACEQLVLELCQKLQELPQVNEAIRRQHLFIAEAEEQERFLTQIFGDAITEQENVSIQHGHMIDRYTEGKQLNAMFGEWLCTQYKWMERNLLKKREDLAKELPEEQKHFIELLNKCLSDLERQRSEITWTMKETLKKQAKKEKDTARQERVKDNVAKAAKSRSKVVELGEEVRKLQGQCNDVDSRIQELRNVLQAASKTDNTVASNRSSNYRRWVESFFYNFQPVEPRKIPAALANEEDCAALLGNYGSIGASVAGHLNEEKSSGGVFQKLTDVAGAIKRRIRRKRPAEDACESSDASKRRAVESVDWDPLRRCVRPSEEIQQSLLLNVKRGSQPFSPAAPYSSGSGSGSRSRSGPSQLPLTF